MTLPDLIKSAKTTCKHDWQWELRYKRRKCYSCGQVCEWCGASGWIDILVLRDERIRQNEIREKALAKLSPEERMVLGL